MNALTGIIIWEDWKVVQSWTGYGCIFFLLFNGVYLLTTVDFFDHYDSLVEDGHAEAVGVEGGSEYAAVKQEEGSSKYGSVAAELVDNVEGPPPDPTTKHRVFYRHRAFHMFKKE